MAVKKVIKMSKGEHKDDDYILKRGTGTTTAKEESAIYKHLLGSRAKITINQDYAKQVSDARRTHETIIKKEFNLKDYFWNHTKQVVFSVLITAAVVILFMVFVNGGYIGVLLFFAPFITIGLTTFYFGIKNLLSSYGASLFLILFGLAFTAMPLYILFTEIHSIAVLPLVFMLAVIVMFILYLYLIKAPTAFGAKLSAEIKGFKMYLETAEQHRLNLINPPDLTPELFEKFLPYAMALDVENEWGAKFESILNGIDYKPDWYEADHFPYRTLGAAMVMPISKAVQQSAAAYSPPGSGSSGSSSGSSGSSSWSSGSSSSGSSGGGGGGGGGGGW